MTGPSTIELFSVTGGGVVVVVVVLTTEITARHLSEDKLLLRHVQGGS